MRGMWSSFSKNGSSSFLSLFFFFFSFFQFSKLYFQVEAEREALKHANCSCSVGSFKKWIAVKPEMWHGSKSGDNILTWISSSKYWIAILQGNWVIFCYQQMWQSHMAKWILKLDWLFNNVNASDHLKITGDYFRSIHETCTPWKILPEDNLLSAHVYIQTKGHSCET